MTKKETQKFILMLLAAITAVGVAVGGVFCWFSYYENLNKGSYLSSGVKVSLSASYKQNGRYLPGLGSNGEIKLSIPEFDLLAQEKPTYYYKITITNETKYSIYASIYYNIIKPSNFPEEGNSYYDEYEYAEMIFDDALFYYGFAAVESEVQSLLSAAAEAGNPNYDPVFAGEEQLHDIRFFLNKNILLMPGGSQVFYLSVKYNDTEFWKIIGSYPEGTALQIISPLSVGVFGSSSRVAFQSGEEGGAEYAGALNEESI